VTYKANSIPNKIYFIDIFRFISAFHNKARALFPLSFPLSFPLFVPLSFPLFDKKIKSDSLNKTGHILK